MDDQLDVEVFRAGDYGAKGRWDEGALDQIAGDYNPELHEAPVTLDHAHNGPALGWVAALRRVGDRLVARLRGLNLKLLELLRAGSFKKRSVELYPALRETGRPYLRAVSFLGAAVPEVKGLADPLFGEEDPEPLRFEDEVGHSCREWPEASGEEARSAECGARNETLGARASSPAEMAEAAPGSPAEAGCNENEVEAATHRLEAGSKEEPAGSRLNSISQTGEQLELPLDEFDDPSNEAVMGNVSFLSFDDLAARLRGAGKWRPAWGERGIAEFWRALAAVDEIEIGEGQCVSAAEWFAGFLESLPPAVTLGEAAPPEGGDLENLMRGGAAVDPASLELHRAAVSFQQSAPGTTYAEALLRCFSRK